MDPARSALRAFVAGDGRVTWSVVALSTSPSTQPGDAIVRLRDGDRVTAELVPHVVELSEGGRFLGVALPHTAFDRIELAGVVVPRHAIRNADRL